VSAKTSPGGDAMGERCPSQNGMRTGLADWQARWQARGSDGQVGVTLDAKAMRAGGVKEGRNELVG
jgi:hypothetical protein